MLRSIQTVQVMFDLNHIWLLNKITLFAPTQCSLAFHYVMIEILLFKFWLRFIKKKLVVMDDAFITTVLTMENVTMSILFALAKVMLSDEGFLIPEFRSNGM